MSADTGRARLGVVFRTLDVSAEAPGQLFLHSMPGRFEDLADARAEIVARSIDRVVCLAPLDEIRQKSPGYARAIEQGVPWVHDAFPITDFGVPHDVAALRVRAASVAAALGRGENVLIHCAAGMGRTGLFATAVLVVNGVGLADALQRVRAAGSEAETPEQRRLLEQLAAR